MAKKTVNDNDPLFGHAEPFLHLHVWPMDEEGDEAEQEIDMPHGGTYVDEDGDEPDPTDHFAFHATYAKGTENERHLELRLFIAQLAPLLKTLPPAYLKKMGLALVDPA